MPNAKNSRSNVFSGDSVFQFSVKRIVSEGAYEKRIAAFVRRICRPLHELGEMIKKRGLHVILIDR